jgi:hypothetical protein
LVGVSSVAMNSGCAFLSNRLLTAPKTVKLRLTSTSARRFHIQNGALRWMNSRNGSACGTSRFSSVSYQTGPRSTPPSWTLQARSRQLEPNRVPSAAW